MSWLNLVHNLGTAQSRNFGPPPPPKQKWFWSKSLPLLSKRTSASLENESFIVDYLLEKAKTNDAKQLELAIALLVEEQSLPV
jgi:hypothetical protein